MTIAPRGKGVIELIDRLAQSLRVDSAGGFLRLEKENGCGCPSVHELQGGNTTFEGMLSVARSSDITGRIRQT